MKCLNYTKLAGAIIGIVALFCSVAASAEDFSVTTSYGYAQYGGLGYVIITAKEAGIITVSWDVIGSKVSPNCVEETYIWDSQLYTVQVIKPAEGVNIVVSAIDDPAQYVSYLRAMIGRCNEALDYQADASNRAKIQSVIDELTAAIAYTYGPSFAIIDDFNDADPMKNFLNLETAAGLFGASDIVTDFDVFGANPDNPLNTAHQMSWDESQGATAGPDDSYWYSFISDGSQVALPITQFTHLGLKLQTGSEVYGNPVKRDVIGIDLQVNYPDGQVDNEGKPFRIYRAYQPIVNWRNLDLTYIKFSDFRDEYDQNIRFSDDLTYNLANLRAVAIAATDPTDNYLTDNDGDGFDLNLDNYGTLFIEDVGFWNKNAAITKKLVIDDFQDGNPTLNNFGLQTGGVDTQSDADENFAGSIRHRMTWHVEHQDAFSALSQYWRSDVSNNGTELLDVSGYTHLAYDVIGQEIDVADLYEAILVVDRGGVDTEFAYIKGANPKRINEEFIPLMEFRQNREGYYDYITSADLARVKEIRFRFGKNYRYFMAQPETLGDDYDGTIWIDNLRLVSLRYDLYNYPPVISSIDGQDTTNDFVPDNPFNRKTYVKQVLTGQPLIIEANASDYNGQISSLVPDLSALPGATFEHILVGPDAICTVTWTPQLSDVGTHTVVFTAADDKGARDIQAFDINVSAPPTLPPVAAFEIIHASTEAPSGVAVFNDTSTGQIANWLWNFGDGTTETSTAHPVQVLHVYDTPGTYTVSLTVTGPGGSNTCTKTDCLTFIPQMGTVGGRVYDAVTNAPIAGATVTLKPYIYGGGVSDKIATTDEDGNYEITDIIKRTSLSGSGAFYMEYSIHVSVTGYQNYVSGYFYFNPMLSYIQCNVALTPIPPVASFEITAYSLEAPGVAIFNDSSTGQITSRLWDFGDGTTETYTTRPAQVVHIYNNPGTYTVSLTVTGPGGADTHTKTDCLKFASRRGTIEGIVTDAITNQPLSGVTVLLKPAFYDYDIKDQTTITDNSGHYVFTNLYKKAYPGGMGVTESYTVNISHPGYENYVSGGMAFLPSEDYRECNVALTPIPPVADFTASPTEGDIPLEVHFTDNSTGNITSYLWEFGDGATSTEQNPVHTYMAQGVFTVRLTTTGPAGANVREETNCITCTFGGAINSAEANKNIILENSHFTFRAEVTPGYFDSYGWLCDGIEFINGAIAHDQISIVTLIAPVEYLSFAPGTHRVKFRASNSALGIELFSDPFTVTVAKDGKVIQDAINAAQAGATVQVPAVPYLLTSDLKITKNIKLVGGHPRKAIIILGPYRIYVRDPLTYAKNEYYYALLQNLTDVTINGFTIKGYKGASQEGAIQNYSKKLTLKNCRIVHNKGVKVGAIYSCWGSQLVLDNTLVAKNTNLLLSTAQYPGLDYSFWYSGYWCGTIYLKGCASLIATNSTIADNINNSNPAEVKYGAVYRDYMNALYFTNSIMWNNGVGAQDFLHRDMRQMEGNVSITYSDIQSTSVYETAVYLTQAYKDTYLPGVWVPGAYDPVLYMLDASHNDINQDPQFIAPEKMNYNISPTSPCKGTGQGLTDMGARFPKMPSPPPVLPFM